MDRLPPLLAARLEALEPAGLRRRLAPAAGVDLCSNDYLGFARDGELASRFAAAVRGLPLGSTGSRLLRGETAIHEEAEAALARFTGSEAAVLFPSGYQANLALLSALLREGDMVLSDELNHASLIDGVRLSRAKKLVYPHADTAELRRLLGERGAGGPGRGMTVIVTESLFSMDGDTAPLADLAAVAREFSALLVVDEAHATGLFGEGAGGGGLVQAAGLAEAVFATIHTGGKALGAGGAWVAGGARLKDYLVNFSRPFIFSTATLPALAALLKLAVEYWGETGRARAREVLERARHLRRLLEPVARPQGSQEDRPHSAVGGNRRDGSEGPIVPLIIGDNHRTVAVARELQRRGFDARAIRPPTVPEGTARLRLTVTWPVGREDLERFAEAAAAALREAER